MQQTNISNTGQPAVIIFPRELRIGNLLLYKGEVVHVTLLSMDIDDEYEETIGFCKLGESTNEISGWNRSLAGGLTPIELSPNLLEKLGFESQDDSMCVYSNGLLKVNFHIRNGTVDFNGERVFDHLVHFHHLQNLYFVLSGSDLKYSTSASMTYKRK